MLTLMFFRHGKSSWDDESIPDRDRPLTSRGRRDAKAAGEWVEAQGLVPDKVFVSGALRARATLDAARESWSKDPIVNLMEALFTKGGTDYFDLVRENGGDTGRLMVVGHNPAMERTAQMLVRTGEAPLRKMVQHTFPTAGIAVMEFEIKAWADLQKHDARIVAFFTPKD